MCTCNPQRLHPPAPSIQPLVNVSLPVSEEKMHGDCTKVRIRRAHEPDKIPIRALKEAILCNPS